jgi:hypothetical protein
MSFTQATAVVVRRIPINPNVPKVPEADVLWENRGTRVRPAQILPEPCACGWCRVRFLDNGEEGLAAEKQLFSHLSEAMESAHRFARRLQERGEHR